MLHHTHRTITRLRLQRWLTAAIAMSLLLAACSKDGGSRDTGGEPVTLKILYWNDQSFQHEYGMLFYALHPEIDVEVVTANSIKFDSGDNYAELYDEFIREQQIDVLFLTEDQYERYAADGRLASLEPFLTRDKIDVEGFIPGLIEHLREKGGGELYGLAPMFSSQVIYYNKDLFDRFNIDYPTDKMSWEEVLNLAARFPTDGSDEDRIWGLSLGGYPSDLYQLGQRIGLTLGLRLVNPADKQLLVDSDAWVEVYEMAHKALRSGTIYQGNNMNFSGPYEEYLLSNPFVGGKAAMMIEGSYLMQQIREAQEYVPDKAVKNWDIVTVPVDPSNPDYTHETSFYQIFAINADSPNREAAWKFIRYVHSDDFARVKAKTFNGQFPVRKSYFNDQEGRNMAAFYLLKPSQASLYANMDDLPGDFYMQYYTAGNEEFQAVMEDRKTVREALASLRTRLQAVMDAAASNPDGGQDVAGTPGAGEASFESGIWVETGGGEAQTE